MKVNVRYFASVREVIGHSTEMLEVTVATVGALRDALIARGGVHAEALARGKAVRAALDQTMVADGAALSEGCEVAFFPPVTGG